MAKVIPFSRKFPAYHIQSGMPTYFVEKMLNALKIKFYEKEYFEWLVQNNPERNQSELTDFYQSLNKNIVDEKFHTVRQGKTHKQGQMFSPRIWIDKPYHSNQIKFAPDQEIKKLIDVEIYLKDNAIKVELGHDNEKNNVVSRFLNSSLIAMNDGLIFYDFYEWFLPYIKKEKVKMKIIMWTDAINY